jgi:hypothetical protein
MKMSDDALRNILQRLNQCHCIDLKLRKDGQDIIEQGDWVKFMVKELLERRGALKPSNLEYLEKIYDENYLKRN